MTEAVKVETIEAAAKALADEIERHAKAIAADRNQAYDRFGMDNTAHTVWPELMRLVDTVRASLAREPQPVTDIERAREIAARVVRATKSAFPSMEPDEILRGDHDSHTTVQAALAALATPSPRADEAVIFQAANGSIGIRHGSALIVLPPEDWHRLADREAIARAVYDYQVSVGLDHAAASEDAYGIADAILKLSGERE